VVDAEDRLLQPVASIPPGVSEPGWEAHPRVEESALASLQERLPWAAAREQGSAIGEPFARDDDVLLPVALAVDGARPGDRGWVVGVYLSTDSICAHIAGQRPPNSEASLWDDAGRELCRGTVGAGEVPFARAHEIGAGTLQFQPEGAPALIAAVAQTTHGWSVVIEQPAARVLAPGRRIRRQSLLWILLSVVGALLAGTILARGITLPLSQLEAGALLLTDADYTEKIALETQDELAEVANAFDAMSDEIQLWDATLTGRVDERTRELEAAQEQLIEARKLGAMAALSAGVAHEINNPLASVLGFTQILLSRASKSGESTQEAELLATVETEALRIRDIVTRMQRLSESQTQGRTSTEVREVIDLVLSQKQTALDEGSVEVERDEPSDLPKLHCNREELTMALGHIVDNAIRAMDAADARLHLQVRCRGGELVVFEIRDNGRGIEPQHLDRVFEPFYTTKDNWRGVGLGLSVAHRMITDHGGTIRIESTIGEGTLVTVTLPASRVEAHLV